MASWIVRTYVRTYLVEPHAESLEQLSGRGGREGRVPQLRREQGNRLVQRHRQRQVFR
jgi:hypothetical protein